MSRAATVDSGAVTLSRLSDLEIFFVDLDASRALLESEEANTPSRRIYFAIQNAYVSDPTEQPVWMDRAYEFIDQLAAATTTDSVRETLAQVRQSLQAGDFYPAMRSARSLFSHDDKYLPDRILQASQTPAARKG